MEPKRTFSEVIVAKPLVLRLNWMEGHGEGGKGQETFLQSIDMLWTAALGDNARRDEYKASKNVSRYGEQIKAGLKRYVAGDIIDWHAICTDIPLLWHGMPPFRKAILQALYEKIGYGQTIRYGQLAALAGSPKAARAVGSAMSANPWPLIVP